jgi:glycerol uptake facilitator protein
MNNGDIFVGEVIGTAILILFGTGVVAAVVLRYSKARASGWIVITFGWGFGVLAGAYTAAPLSGGHINPAVTLGIAIDTGKWDKVWVYLLGQMVGAMLGAVLCYLTYFAQFRANIRETGTTEGTEEEPVPTLGIFSTIPEIRNPVANLMTEIIATIGLVLPILAFGLTEGLGWSSPCSSSASASRSVGRPATPSTPHVTWAHASCTPSCRFRTRAPPTGVTHGFRSSAR